VRLVCFFLISLCGVSAASADVRYSYEGQPFVDFQGVLPDGLTRVSGWLELEQAVEPSFSGQVIPTDYWFTDGITVVTPDTPTIDPNAPFQTTFSLTSDSLGRIKLAGIRIIALADDAGELSGLEIGSFDGAFYCSEDNPLGYCGAPPEDRALSDSPGQWVASETPLVLLDEAFVRCVGDVNTDGVQDVAMLLTDGATLVKGFNNQVTSRFEVAHLVGEQPVHGVEAYPDINGNGSPELVVLGLRYSGVLLVLQDILSGEPLDSESVSSRQGRQPVELMLVDDITGDGRPEVGVLTDEPPAVTVWDIQYYEQPYPYPARISWISAGQKNLPEHINPVDMELYPDSNGDGDARLRQLEAGVLNIRNKASKSDRFHLFDLGSSYFTYQDHLVKANLSKEWRLLQQASLTDLNGDSYPEVAILRVNHADGRSQVIIKDFRWSGERLAILPMDAGTESLRLMAIPDINGNGSDEIAVLSRKLDGSNQKVKIKDSRTRKTIHAVYFDKNFSALDIATCPDIDNNGAVEFVVLGQRQDNGKVRAIIKDSKSRALVGKIDFTN